MTEQQFDVFLAHSSKDKPLIRQIYRKLKEVGISPWLDEEEIAPGTKFQDEIQQAIGRIKTTAIFLGQGGLGPWQALELKSFISQCVRRDIPVIPVLLPGVEEIPEELIFLQEFHAVLFRDGIEDENALFSLEWGITGQKPTRQPRQPQAAPPTTPPVAPPPAPEDDLNSEKGEGQSCGVVRRSAGGVSMSTKRFRIAFSFAGEKREFVEAIAVLLTQQFGEDKILYDKYHEAEFARYDLGIYLPKLYGEQSDLIVPVLCPNYDTKRWTGWEWVHIYGLLTKADSYRVMPCRFEYANVDGLSPAAGFIELDQKTPAQAATLILERLALNEGRPKDHYTKASGSGGARSSANIPHNLPRRIDYRKLRDLLKAGQWQEADGETYETMIRAVGKESGDWFTSDELLNFPCTDLLTIDRLWTKYSNGKFGFSVQKQIYVDCGAKLDGKDPGDKVWHEFCDRVGWRKAGDWVMYGDLESDLYLSPTGEFPWQGTYHGLARIGVLLGSGKVISRILFLFSRTEACRF